MPDPAQTGTFWRVEGSLLSLSAVRVLAYVTWNTQSFSERWARRFGMAFLAVCWPLLYFMGRRFATRLLYIMLRGVSQDRLDLLGEEYFEYILKPQLKPGGLEKLRQAQAAGPVILVSHALDHIIRPLANHLGVENIVANRLDFRDGIATGRLLEPVVRPRRLSAWLTGHRPDGRVSAERVLRDIGLDRRPDLLSRAIFPARRRVPQPSRPALCFDPRKRVEHLSVHKALAGKRIMLIGVTGFIGKVWLANLLNDLPEIGKIYLLIRRQRSTTATRRLEKIVEESPVFDGLYQRYGEGFARFLSERIEVVEGDVSQPGLGLDPELRARLAKSLDLVLNSSGLTDFNPDLREALSANVDAVVHMLDFMKQCDHAALMHLSTCYVVGARDGRVAEELVPDYTPKRVPGFDAEHEWRKLHKLAQDAAALAEGPSVTEKLRRKVRERTKSELTGPALENQLRKERIRWLRNHLTLAGMRRARALGWPNTYCLTKSLAESLIARLAGDVPVAIVRPSIVETSVGKPFCGWNEGVNTSASLAYLLGTSFRQLPSNERKCLDVIPVDQVCQGMTLIAAALIERRHQRMYQLATSVTNPCDMRRSIELTGLAHRRHLKAEQGLESWLRLRWDAIPVSRTRFRRFGAPGQRAMIRAIIRVVGERRPFVKAERRLERVERIVRLYEPFILNHDHVFEAEHVEILSQALPP
ncbi:MAG TPA: SDR family oxidoreductase, partial [Terriglobales bacterium]|nr:SDR family oxidoreductase [Terriglobales bacterium]